MNVYIINDCWIALQSKKITFLRVTHSQCIKRDIDKAIFHIHYKIQNIRNKMHEKTAKYVRKYTRNIEKIFKTTKEDGYFEEISFSNIFLKKWQQLKIQSLVLAGEIPIWLARIIF